MNAIEGTVFVVDDDAGVRESTVLFLAHQGWPVRAFDSAEAFLEHVGPEAAGCLLLDIRMPGTSGLELQGLLGERGYELPIIFLTGHGDIRQSVLALKRGAVDFLEKPYDQDTLCERLREALVENARRRGRRDEQSSFLARRKTLTPREREVMDRIVTGLSNKEIARELAISHRTVDAHRAGVMRKMDVGSLAELAARAVAADGERVPDATRGSVAGPER